MFKQAFLSVGVFGVACALSAHAQKPSSAPANSLGQCKDGSYVSTGSKRTACILHGGMSVWYQDGTPNAGGAIPQDDGKMEPGKTATGRVVNGVPSDALGLCNDGTYISTGTKHSACSLHRGMKIWYPDGTPNN